MNEKMKAENELISVLKKMGYPEDFGRVIAGELRTEKAMKRMSSYLRQACPESPEEIADEMRSLLRERAAKQPLNLPSAGSTFKRPTGYYAGKLIQDAGLRGARVGGAQVSEKHCGFVVNAGGATASDVRALIHHVQTEVERQFGVRLEPEVRMLG